MKRLITLIGLISIAGLLNFGVVNANPNAEKDIASDYKPQKPATVMPPTYIDKVPVPYEILVYAQVVHQGYAVTQAGEIIMNGKKVYQLRIDNDSNPHDYNGMYLLYDEAWKLIDKKPLTAPVVTERKPEEIVETKPVPPPAENTVEEVPEEPEITQDSEQPSEEEPDESDNNQEENNTENDDPENIQPSENDEEEIARPRRAR